MIKLTILLLTFSFLASGQDSLLIRETCRKINELKNSDDKMAQINIVSGQLMGYLPTIVNTPNERRVKATYTFQYKLHRELRRTCPKYLIDHAPRIVQRVIDFEDKFSRPEIDSIENVCVRVSRIRNVYMYVVTIDDYFPDNAIEDFSSRNRESWGGKGFGWENGTIMISMSVANRQLRISTGDESIKYLTDEECSGIVKIMIPYFKKGEYFNGVLKGLEEIGKRL